MQPPSPSQVLPAGQQYALASSVDGQQTGVSGRQHPPPVAAEQHWCAARQQNSVPEQHCRNSKLQQVGLFVQQTELGGQQAPLGRIALTAQQA
jgi:hypothetical protein